MRKMAYIAILLLVSGCDLDAFNPRSEHCSGYNSSFLAGWFPYSIDETFYFTTGSGTRDTLLIDAISKTAPYSIKEALDGNDENCHAEAQINTFHKYDANRPSNATIEIKHHLSGYLGIDVGSITYRRFTVRVKIISNEISYILPSDSSDRSMEMVASVTLNGKTFNDVIIFSGTDTLGATYEGIDKLYIARSSGVVGYRTYPAGDIYAKE